MKYNVEYFKKYYVNATKEEVIEDMFLDCCEQAKEIVRLNNIINELEKEFDNVIKDPLIHMCYKRLARKYADKLQELKGSDKE